MPEGDAPERRPTADPAEQPVAQRLRDETAGASFSDPQDARVGSYQAISSLAVIGLLFGLLSPLALLTPALWLAPLVGIGLCLLALERIAQEAPALIGRKAAVVGLLLSVVFAVAGPTEWLTRRWLLRREAQAFATGWFELLRERQPHMAHQLTQHPGSRRALDDTLWSSYTNDWQLCQEIRDYVKQPLVRTLLALKDRAEVRHYQTEEQSLTDDGDALRQVYAVTFEQQGDKKTFFVRVHLERVPLRKDGKSGWRVQLAEGGIQPTALGGQPKRP